MSPLELKNLISKIPKKVLFVTDTLEEAGFEAYLVGGCIRDILIGREPKDWDITTNAKPEQIIGLFEKTVYENEFGTVMVIQEDVSQETLRQIEVTPYRIEAKYTDFRHPDGVLFSNDIEDDLKRRDFTVNAMAFRPKGHDKNFVDIFGGLKDIKDKILKAVGEPDDRFVEDPLRMLRAIRIALQLGFSISYESSESILKNADLIKKISPERIRDEFIKIIISPNPSVGIVMLQKFGLLKNIIPELEEGIGCEQSGEHIYDVWNHLLHALQHAADKDWPLEVRLAALFHDIGKPKSRRSIEIEGNALRRSHTILEGQDQKLSQRILLQAHPSISKKKYTFYGHEVIGYRMAKKILERLKFSKKEIELIEKLVRNHMFFSDTELITLSAVRRIISKVGKENIWLLMDVRECDRVGMKKKEAPYRLRKYFAMIEEALHDPISVGQLKIDGEFMIKELKIKPGPRMGWILHALLEEVLDDPTKNDKGHLSLLVESLNMLGDNELRTLGERGKEKKDELEIEEIDKLKKRHGVK
ncbi:MAG: Polynucleotide adenylyltransferase/metal dependent phosphohydrolase [Candidatus Nomurabacteria bacterium GW2011_GWE1_32_28]|uniref:Polynucleotide adenylyltransferase/metal dependent phosphohydrolase n=1 Tax=Candidatus Nomurabacteria bacterium GW2011_GWF1_31_48 TaxID=1618767 RepID=A0A0F9YV93_9BACT|nr:MAG: Polynucleotide adenylyltransferase/metal dependent phosphohydrolase [Candidatus Nomurabacteria bacterium GW2011_GWF2_30_133]KKP28813.1 MAG: Polynucleotide adenylyltransferase/metal dependent phosphohydrolase [Candidatus Nomurabacteria bacterium GW2011_GWE2_31_40]KKP30391.1 MAG: Polynucleotide adenylyltransferase/metal dependent phosphohydrolase [Candidatus Nomurabacteria bacterium GW2011_GWF1_31_48]KKP34918.1 MAG: Polynucleotide adenylyltransferase/metal dependent phosphohydrolase [Candi